MAVPSPGNLKDAQVPQHALMIVNAALCFHILMNCPMLSSLF
jgi:hypothetical protein